MARIRCSCERELDAELPEEIDLDLETRRLEEILSGDFLAVDCPYCGTRVKPEPRVRLRSRKFRLDAYVVPELERLAAYLGSVKPPKGSELIIGYAELYERALIVKAGLDPEAVEILKYWVWAKAGEEAPEGAAPVVSFAGREEDGRLRFSIAGLREGELAILRLPAERYEATVKDKARIARDEPFDRILAGPYRSVRALEAEAD